MKKPLVLTACLAATLFAAGCGDDEQPIAAVPARLDADADPKAPAAAGTLATIADSKDARTRLGYVNADALRELGGPLPAAEIQRLVLGTAGSKRLDGAEAAGQIAVQVGDATVLTAPERTVVGGSASLRSSLESTSFETSAITEETQSAVQSCLGDAAAQVIVGPAVVGKWAAVGAGVVNDSDQPAGPKVRVCVAPHWVREVHHLEEVLGEKFPATGDPATRPVVAEVEIGEREMIGATVSLETIAPGLLRDYLAGGPELVGLIKR